MRRSNVAREESPAESLGGDSRWKLEEGPYVILGPLYAHLQRKRALWQLVQLKLRFTYLGLLPPRGHPYEASFRTYE